MTTTSYHKGICTKGTNKKLGKHVTSVQRAAGITCPGESEWCARCYAIKGFFVRYKLQTRYAAEDLVLPQKAGPLFRWHVSGDFDSPEIIATARDYAIANPDTKFWAYTRSWRIPALLPHLAGLRALPNVQLFASTDPTIVEEPPAGWRIAYIEGDPRYQGSGMTCLENTGVMPDCEACTYCWRKPRGHVGFPEH